MSEDHKKLLEQQLWNIGYKTLFNNIEKWDIEENMQKSIDWFRINMVNFYNVVNPIWSKVK